MQGCVNGPDLGVGAPPPRLSQNLAGLLGKKQIHLGGGSLSAGIQVLRWESLVSTIKTKRKERFLFFIAPTIFFFLFSQPNIMINMDTPYCYISVRALYDF